MPDVYPLTVSGEAVPFRPSQRPRATASDLIHILYGDPNRGGEGGHFYGVGVDGKYEFPERWDEDACLAAVDETLRVPNRVRRITLSKWAMYRVHDGVLVLAVIAMPPGGPPAIITAMPLGGDGVVQNVNGRKERRVLDLDRMERYP